MKKKGRKAFWHNFKFKYKLTITNENTLEEIVGLHVSKLNGVSVLLSAVTVIFLISATIIVFTPLRNYLPGYMNSEERTRQEEEFRKQYEESERYNLTAVDDNNAASGLIFYRPTRGMMSSNFDLENRHYGVDIAANPNESVLATLDGTVILSTYTAETGYVIQIQHGQDFVSVYKHCGSLLKKEGDPVKGGEAIALVGNTGEKTTGPHLHFGLWHKGRAIDPSKYIVF